MVLTRLRLTALAAILVSCRAPEATSVRSGATSVRSGATSVRLAGGPALVLHDSGGGEVVFPGDLAGARFTVVVFYAEHCPCFRVHEARLRAIPRAYPGVKLLVVDSEVAATVERDAREGAARGLPAIVLDPGAKLADALGADYATYAVVFDDSGRVRYRGGIDDDKNVVHPDAKAWLRDALDDLTAGREPRRAEGKALGCALQKQ